MKDKRTIDDVLVDFGEDFIRYASWGDDEKIDECIAQAHSEILDIVLSWLPKKVERNDVRDDDSNHSWDSAEAFNQALQQMKECIETERGK